MFRDYDRYYDAAGGEITSEIDTERVARRLIEIEAEARMLRQLTTTPQPATYVKPLGKRATLASLNPDTNALDLVRGDRHFSLAPDELDELHAWLDRVHPLTEGVRKEWHEWDCSCDKCMKEIFE